MTALPIEPAPEPDPYDLYLDVAEARGDASRDGDI